MRVSNRLRVCLRWLCTGVCVCVCVLERETLCHSEYEGLGKGERYVRAC